MSCKCDTINIVNDNNVIVISHADGRDGKSAYQQAVEGGYTGTEQEFNCSLSLLADVAEGKKQIADAINYKGGKAEPTQAFTELAENIKDIPNFNTKGCEYISDIYKPTTLLDAYYNRYYIKSIVDNYVEEISGAYTFYNCTSLQNVQLPSLVTISGTGTFQNCTALQSVQFPSLVTIRGSNTFNDCTSLQSVQFPSLVTISGFYTFYGCTSLQSVQFPSLVTISGTYTFYGCTSLQSVQFPSLVTISGTGMFQNCTSLQNIELGTLIKCVDPFGNTKTNLRNITIGQDTDVDLPFQNWTATNVINERQSGIDELNDNLYNNLLTKLYDHSTDGQTRTLRLGWLAYVTQENIDYANSKGWTLTK